MNSGEKGKGPRLIAFEVTRGCNLKCVHCRASAQDCLDPLELTTQECKVFLGQVREVGSPIVILTGGEPLLRKDIFEIAEYGHGLGLKMVMATNGTLLSPEIVSRLKAVGIKRVSVSIDGHDAKTHDGFRKVEGAFERAMDGIQCLREMGMEFQINTTITRENVDCLKEITDLALKMGAAAHHIFLLVPVGRGKEIAELSIEANEYEEILTWFCGLKEEVPMELKATCAPQFYRIMRQEAHRRGKSVSFETHGLDAVTRGCLAGTGFCFVSHKGIVQPCGYLEVGCGDIRKAPFKEIWESSPVFLRLRDRSLYKGKCKDCEYFQVCGGCRARAYEFYHDYLAQEPLCNYVPRAERPKGR